MGMLGFLVRNQSWWLGHNKAELSGKACPGQYRSATHQAKCDGKPLKRPQKSQLCASLKRRLNGRFYTVKMSLKY